MQTLEPRNTYTPTNAPQVRCNCDPSLNRGKAVGEAVEETLSVPGLKTFSNNSDVDQLPIRKEKKRQNLRVSVCVLNMRGQPLMPTTPKKARKLLKTGEAKVVKRVPFTIQLNYSTGETKQPIRLGIDTGSSYVGFSAVSAKKELISGEIELRNDIPEKLTERKQYRRNRRNKLRYREPRFNNRSRTEKYSPSIKQKLNTCIKNIELVKYGKGLQFYIV